MVFYFDVACPPGAGKWIVYMVRGERAEGEEREKKGGRRQSVMRLTARPLPPFLPLHPAFLQGRDKCVGWRAVTWRVQRDGAQTSAHNRLFLNPFFSLTPPPPFSRYENEDLIRYGLPHDIWFHVDDLSSAHVYLRPPPGGSIDAIPERVLADACQLTKANSITGAKTPSVAIVYTPHPNLVKRDGYDIGTVGFRDEAAVRRVAAVKKDAAAVSRLEKTKREVTAPDLAGELAAHEREVAAAKRAEAARAKAEEKAARAAAVAAKEARSYDRLFDDGGAMTTPAEVAAKYKSAADYEDDFM